jgi:hypothetical protein
MRAKSVKKNLKKITNRGVFCGKIRPILKNKIDATRRRFFMRFFLLLAATPKNIVLGV